MRPCRKNSKHNAGQRLGAGHPFQIGPELWVSIDRISPNIAPYRRRRALQSQHVAERRYLGSITHLSSQLESLAGSDQRTALIQQFHTGRNNKSVRCLRDLSGRPRVCVDRHAGQLDVSTSHGGGLVGTAISRKGNVGLDLEPTRRIRTHLLDSVCTPSERAAIEDASSQLDTERYFAQLWTLKESLLKATGDGLSVDPRDIEFAIGSAPRLLKSPFGTGWRFRSFEACAGTYFSLCWQRRQSVYADWRAFRRSLMAL